MTRYSHCRIAERYWCWVELRQDDMKYSSACGENPLGPESVPDTKQINSDSFRHKTWFRSGWLGRRRRDTDGRSRTGHATHILTSIEYHVLLGQLGTTSTPVARSCCIFCNYPVDQNEGWECIKQESVPVYGKRIHHHTAQIWILRRILRKLEIDPRSK